MQAKFPSILLFNSFLFVLLNLSSSEITFAWKLVSFEESMWVILVGPYGHPILAQLKNIKVSSKYPGVFTAYTQTPFGFTSSPAFLCNILKYWTTSAFNHSAMSTKVITVGLFSGKKKKIPSLWGAHGLLGWLRETTRRVFNGKVATLFIIITFTQCRQSQAEGPQQIAPIRKWYVWWKFS